MTSARTKAYIYLLIATAIWAIAGPVIKVTLDGVPPLLFLVYRFAISSALSIFIFSKITFNLPKDPKILLLLFLNGLFSSTIALSLLFFGLKNTTVLDLTLITLMAPLLAAESGVRFLHERITLREKIGMAIALIGTIFIVIEPMVSGHGLISDLRTSGNALLLVYLIVSIVPVILTKKLLRAKVNPITITNMEFLVGFITLFPVLLYKYGAVGIVHEISILELKYHLGVIFMALLSGSLAYTLFNKAQKTIEVGEAAVFAYLNPLFTAPLAVLWLHEKITPQFIAGAAAIALGVTVAEYKRTKLSKIEKTS